MCSKMTALSITFCILVISASVQGSYKYPFMNPNLGWYERVNDLIDRLTLEEAVQQTMASYSFATPAVPRLGIKPYVWITECLRGQVGTNATAFPQAIGLSATFSPELIQNMSEVISTEVRAVWNYDVSVNQYKVFRGLSCFSPVINIMRHPLWGRNQETYGEDPYLSGQLVHGFVHGLQGNHSRYVRANAGCKHFDAHGGPENIPVSRMSFDAKVSMRDWRMTFLPQFKKCVEAGTYNLMCSYNSINGVPSCANKKLLTDITRHEWGFKGYIVSDDLAIPNIFHAHNYTHSNTDTVTVAIKAGCNLELGSDIYNSTMAAYKLGNLTVTDIKENLIPLMYTRMRLGEFDPVEMNPYNKINMSVVQSPEHQALAVRAAQMSFVLLKNDKNVLPLKKKYNKVAVVGPMAHNRNQLFGDYAANINMKVTKTPYEGLGRVAGSAVLGEGCHDTSCKTYNQTTIQTAVTGADLVIVCLGTGQDLEREGYDRSTIALAGQQLQLLQDAVKFANGASVVLLMFNAGPLDISWAKASPGVGAIMECFFPAQATGTALYNTITGSGPYSVPAGRLSATWPTHDTQVPPITNYTMVGRTYRYYNGDPLYPFGYGLSYSTFKYTAGSVTPSSVEVGQLVVASVTVQNMGPYDADEVVQVYMSWGNPSVPAPKLQLVGINRVYLKNGETKTLSFTISSEQMAVWVDDTKGFDIIPGPMKLFMGGQQPAQATSSPSNIVSSTFMLMAPPTNKTAFKGTIHTSKDHSEVIDPKINMV